MPGVRECVLERALRGVCEQAVCAESATAGCGVVYHTGVLPKPDRSFDAPADCGERDAPAPCGWAGCGQRNCSQCNPAAQNAKPLDKKAAGWKGHEYYGYDGDVD